MSYAKGFEYDVFVSYAAVDDSEVLAENKRGWVSSFVQHLESALHIRLGGREKLRIYFDSRNLAGNHRLQEILDAVSRSAIFLAVTSPAYVERDWTKKELETFVKVSTNPRSLFAIEYLPLDEGENYPDPLINQKRLKFWEKDGALSLTAMSIMAGHEYYRSRIHDLADQMKKQLTAINNAEVARPAIGQTADVIAYDAAKRARGVIYLAQTTDDLEEERLQIQRAFDQLGFLVLPAADLPGGGDSFRAAAEADINQADLYVHLLGPRGGRTPADLPDGYAMTQFKVAATLGKKRLLWRHPELDIDKVTDSRQKELLGDEDLIACGLQQLILEARRLVEEAVRPKHDPDAKLLVVFINATKEDLSAAKIAEQEFASRNVFVTTPLYSGSAKARADDLTQNMLNCEVMVMIYGNAPIEWVRGQMLRFIKVRGGKPARLVAIFAGPPEEKPVDLGFTMPRLRRVDFLNGWSAQQIRKVIEEIGV